MAIGLSKYCKWVFNEASPTLWYHAVFHFDVKMSRFSTSFQDDCVES